MAVSSKCQSLLYSRGEARIRDSTPQLTSCTARFSLKFQKTWNMQEKGNKKYTELCVQSRRCDKHIKTRCVKVIHNCSSSMFVYDS